jgi:competence protein ComEA
MDVPKLINLNKASKDELMQVDGIDERKADDIIKMRDRKGHIDSVDDLTEVEGITRSALDPMRPKLQV